MTTSIHRGRESEPPHGPERTPRNAPNNAPVPVFHPVGVVRLITPVEYAGTRGSALAEVLEGGGGAA